MNYSSGPQFDVPSELPENIRAILETARDIGLTIKPTFFEGVRHQGWTIYRRPAEDYLTVRIAPTPLRYAVTCHLYPNGSDKDAHVIPTRDAISALMDF